MFAKICQTVAAFFVVFWCLSLLVNFFIYAGSPDDTTFITTGWLMLTVNNGKNGALSVTTAIPDWLSFQQKACANIETFSTVQHLKTVGEWNWFLFEASLHFLSAFIETGSYLPVNHTVRLSSIILLNDLVHFLIDWSLLQGGNVWSCWFTTWLMILICKSISQ